MKRRAIFHGITNWTGRSLVAVACAVLLVPGESVLLAQTAPPAAAPAAADAEADDPPLTADQLESLVAPIALYPDDLLAQVLASSTYPLELVQLQQWMGKHKDLKDKALADAVGKESWDPSVKSMAAVPEALKRLTDDIQWTTDLGNAFLDQQKEVMDACQRMRKKAKDKGALTSNEQMKVETKVIEQKEVIIVQSSNPEVIYVPSYNPTVVYPPPVYPYPPVYYPPYVPGAAFMSFSFGVMMGAAWGGSCCGCGWGGGNVNVNVNNNFNRNTNINGGNRGQGGGNWNHNPSHRGGTPYGNKASANKYGGQTRGQQASARQQGGRGTSGASNRAAGGAGGSRGGPSAGTSDRSGGGGSRGGASPSASDRSAGGGGSRGGGDSIGGRDVGGGGGSRGGSSGFGGGSGSSARSSSSRGASSMGSRGGGGGSRGGGGGRGGGGRR